MDCVLPEMVLKVIQNFPMTEHRQREEVSVLLLRHRQVSVKVHSLLICLKNMFLLSESSEDMRPVRNESNISFKDPEDKESLII